MRLLLILLCLPALATGCQVFGVTPGQFGLWLIGLIDNNITTADIFTYIFLAVAVIAIAVWRS